jgi:3-oxoacyl-(acyl-carrier-protein) synthase
MDRMSKWGIICAEILLQQKSLDSIDAYQRAIVLQNSASSLNTDKNFQESIGIIPSPALFVYTLPNIVMGEIAIRHNFKGENTFIVSAAFNKTQLEVYSNMLLESNFAKIILCGYLEVDAQTQEIAMWLSEADSI